MLLIYIRIFIVIKRNEFSRKNLAGIPLETRANATVASQTSNQDKLSVVVDKNHYKVDYSEHQVPNISQLQTADDEEKEKEIELTGKEGAIVDNKTDEEKQKLNRNNSILEETNGDNSNCNENAMSASCSFRRKRNSLRQTIRETKACLIQFKWYHPTVARRMSSSTDSNSVSTEITDGSLRFNRSVIARCPVVDMDPPTEDSLVNYSIRNSPDFSPVPNGVRENSRRNRMYLINLRNHAHVYHPNRRHHHGQSFVVRRSQSHSKALFTTLIILGTYLFCWMPAVVFLAVTCEDGCPYPILSVSPLVRILVSVVCNALVVLKAIVDPFIYTLRMKDVKNAIRRMRGM